MATPPRTTALLGLHLCLLLWAPRASWAASVAAQDAPRRTFDRLALSGPLADAESPPAPAVAQEKQQKPRGLRLLVEVGTGAVTALAGGAGGVLLGSRFESNEFIVPAFYLGVLGAGLGYGLGVWWGGELMGGDGQLLYTMGLSLGLFTADTLLMSLLLPAVRDAPRGVPLVMLATLPLSLMLGAHLGYELFQRDRPASRGTTSRPRVQPVVSLSAHGALLGLGGQW